MRRCSHGDGLENANNGVPSPRDQSAFVLPISAAPEHRVRGPLAPQATLGIGGASVAIGPPFATVEGYFDWSSEFRSLN